MANKFLLSKPPVYSILLQQPQLTNVASSIFIWTGRLQVFLGFQGLTSAQSEYSAQNVVVFLLYSLPVKWVERRRTVPTCDRIINIFIKEFWIREGGLVWEMDERSYITVRSSPCSPDRPEIFRLQRSSKTLVCCPFISKLKTP